MGEKRRGEEERYGEKGRHNVLLRHKTNSRISNHNLLRRQKKDFMATSGTILR